MKSLGITSTDVNPTEIIAEIYLPQAALKTVKYLFEEDAWEKLLMFVKDKMEVLKNQCCGCLEISSVDELISCDRCLKQFHFACGKSKKTKKAKQQWFCNYCKIEVKNEVIDGAI